MRIQAKSTAQTAYLDDGDAGEGLSIFFSQGRDDQCRWKLDVQAKLDTGVELSVGSFYVSPPTAVAPFDRLSRLVAIAVCPGAVSWSVTCTPLTNTDTNEDAGIDLFSSKCCTAPCGLSRVSERYGQYTGGSPATLNVFPGVTITRIQAIGLGGGGTFTISGGTPIAVPAGGNISLEPKAPIPPGINVLAFTNVAWVVEYLESA